MNKKICFYTSEKEAKKDAEKNNRHVFYLEADNWDDYGFKTLFILYKVDSYGKLNSVGRIKIARKGLYSGRPELPPEPFESLDENYFSLGADKEYYSDLKKLKFFNNVLMALQDVAYLGTIDECESKCKKLYASEEAFRSSLLRDKDIATVTRDYRGIVKDDVRHYKMISFSYQFNSEGKNSYDTYSSKELKCVVQFKDFPPSNIHVLIGANGVGKTKLLNQIVKSYIFDKNSSIDDIIEEDHIPISIIGVDTKNQLGELKFAEDAERNDKELSFSHITYVPVDLTVNNDTFNVIPEKNGERVRKLVNIFVAGELCEKKNESNVFIENYKQLKVEQGNRAEKIIEYYSMLLGALTGAGSSFIPVLDSYVLQDEKEKFAKWFCEENLKKLSSGQLRVLYLFYSMTNIGKRGLYVIDEPENSLHAPLLSAFMYVLRNVLVEKEAMAIIATHSPIVLREVPKKCVHILQSVEGLRCVISPTIETFGENLGVLLNEVFGVNADKSGYFSFLKDKIVEEYKEKECEKEVLVQRCLDKFGGELGMEARALLPYIIDEALSEIEEK